MSACDDFISLVENAIPDMATTSDLVRVGIYRSDQAACNARRIGKCPEYFKFNDKVVFYPKKAVIEFLKKSKFPGSEIP